MGIKLRMTGMQHAEIKKHVIAPDGKEAGSLLFCKPVFRDEETILLVKRIEHVPYDACIERTPVFLSWPTQNFLMPHYESLEREGLSLIMLHSHPTGEKNFSITDNENDLRILSRLATCIDGVQPHGSAIMLPDGSINGRIFCEDGNFIVIDLIAVADDGILFFSNSINNANELDCTKKTAQVYGAKTTNILRELRIGVVGCSGTGSPTIELLLRHHVGELALIDFDEIDHGNLNRVIASRTKDADVGKLKVERSAEWILETGLPTKVTVLNDLVPSKEATQLLAKCDIIFGCVDNVAARHTLNKISCAYLIPYFDLGVAIKKDHKRSGEIRQAIARCHYIQPDQLCLLDRGAYSSERLAEENWRRDNPEFYQNLKALGYTQERNEIQAVMTLTMRAAIMGVDDMIARLNNYRIEPNKEFDEQEHSFTHGYYEHRSHSGGNRALRSFVAVGDQYEEL